VQTRIVAVDERIGIVWLKLARGTGLQHFQGRPLEPKTTGHRLVG
jgi:hypothetical protein